MKGIIHIAEIVIVAMVMFFAVLQFTYIPRMETDWAGAKLSMQGWDILFTLDEKGINWLDPAGVRTEIGKMLNGTNTQFGLTVRGAPPSDVSVGCICSSQETLELENMLTGITLNGEEVSFSVERIDPADMRFSHENDVIFIRDYDLTGCDIQLANYLMGGRGIVEVRDLGQDDLDAIQSGMFGLAWDSSLSPDNGNISFASVPAQAESYRIYKYFHSIPNSSGQTYPGPYEFESFLSGERVIQKDNDTRRIVMVQEGTGVPASIINYGVSGGAGRSAWLSAGLDSRDDKKVLIKSLVLWAAGNEFDVVESDVSAAAASFSFFKVLNQDMYQPVEIMLSLGYLY
jgi:hypothetical protein